MSVRKSRGFHYRKLQQLGHLENVIYIIDADDDDEENNTTNFLPHRAPSHHRFEGQQLLILQ